MGRRAQREQRGPYGLGEDDGAGTPITVAGAAAKARLARLEADVRVRAAAIVAATFHLDPAAVLDELDPLKADVRIAAHNVVQTAREQAARARK